MIDLNPFRKNPAARVHFIGCEGAGTKPLRRIFDELGFRTSGSDLTLNGHAAANLPDTPDPQSLLVIYSSAVADDNPELQAARRRGSPCILRGEALGLAASLFPCVIAVSGSHGKTSVTSMIVHILRQAGLAPGFLIGGKLQGGGLSGSAGGGRIFVCEADESDGTHTAIHSALAVVTNVEDDHAWNFDSPECLIRNFRQFARQGKKLLAPALPIFEAHPDRIVYNAPDELEHDPRFCRWAHFAKIDLEIAVEAVTALELLSREAALRAAESFPGVARRMELHGASEDFLLYTQLPFQFGAMKMIVKVPQFVTQPGGQHSTFNNLLRVHTGCYTKEAFAIINGMVNSEKKDFTFPRMRLHDAIFISDLPPGSSAVWQAMDYKLLLDGVEVPMDGVNIEDDGEITLLISIVVMPFRKDGKYVTERKVCMTLDYYFNNVFIPGTTLNKHTKERLAEMMKLIKKAINGSLTEKDRKSKLFDAAVGKPFNPFEQQVFKMKKQALIEESNKLYGRSLDRTEKDEIMKILSVKFDELIDCLR